MKVKLADKAGFCFGVKRAVDEAIDAQKKFNKRIYTLGPLIHNNDVVNYLKENNIYAISIDELSNLEENDVIIIRSHGVAKDILNKLIEKKLNLVDATCPYVSNIHKKVEKHHELGYSILIVGDKNHPEVIGINGWCNNEAIICKSGNEIKDLPKKLCVVSQTTEKQSNWQEVLSIVVKQCKEFVAFNTICSATELRQKSADQLSRESDMMIIIGGKNSSNTTKLYEICKTNCLNTIHIENSGEIPDDINSKNIKTIGVTAGASTPDWIIKEAILKMSDNKSLEVNEQLAYMDKHDKEIILGEIVKGIVVSVNDKEAFLNIGHKSEAVLYKNEVTKNEEVNLRDILKVGDEISAKIIRRKNEEGHVVLSKLEIEREAAYGELKKSLEENTSLNVLVKDAVNGGLVTNYKGVRVFVPASHVELFHVDNLSEYVGKELEVKVIEYNEEKKGTRIVASRRNILKLNKEKKESETWNSLEKDMIVDGEVRRLNNFGAFVEVQGVDGLLHVSEISWGRIEKPDDVLKVGDKIKVYILDIDKENKKLSLSIKKLTENPWNNVDIKYPIGSIVLGKIVRFASFGAFVELEPGVDALVHISQITHKRVNKVEDVLNIGQEVKAKILEVNKDTRKIGLSIKEVDEI